MRLTSLRRRLLAGIAVSILAAPLALPAAPARAQSTAPAAPVAFDIAGGSLDAALIAFAKQSGRPLLYSQSLVQGLQSAGLKGRFTPEDAIARLLVNVPVNVERNSSQGFVLKRRAQPIAYAQAAPGAADETEADEAAEPRAVEGVVVTGSQIRGAGEIASPLVTVSQADIDRSGRATLAEVLTELPQAFGGQNSPDTVLTNTDRSGANNSVSTGVNLRGLGASSTLVLVNGRRMAGTGLSGDFADVSALPSAATERVEVLLDGASAIYGSDAVGGVINIILKRDFEGAESRVRLGAARGGASERLVSHTAGAVWSSGNILASVEAYQRDALPSAARAFTGNADLRPQGGTDRRLTFSHPGNIMVLDVAAGAYVPTWAIPAGQTGTGLTPASFQRGVVNYENQREGTDVLPEQTRRSGYLAFTQALSPRLEISGDARFTRRDFAFALPGSPANLTVTRANPYFVSPNGSASHVIAYAFTDELGPLRTHGRSDSAAASLGGHLDLGRTWRASAYGAYAEESGRRFSPGRLNTRFLNEALGNIADDPATAFSAARDGYFNPFGDGGANGRAVLDFIGSGYINWRTDSAVTTYNAQADGALFTLPGGEVKLAVGAQERRETFEAATLSMTSAARQSVSRTGPFRRTVTAGFLEIRAPVVGPDNALPLVRRLEVSLAARTERYSDVGETTNPKVGVVWAPGSALTLRATYGRSFRAPSLKQVFDPQDGGATFLPQAGVNKLVLLRFGGNPNLTPETAESWTAGADFVSRRWPGLRLSATWFDTQFRNQIGTPVYDNIFNVLGNPAYGAFVQTIDPNNPADLAKVDALLAGTTSVGLYPTNAFTAIVDGRNLNTGGLQVRGVDLSARHRLAVGGGGLDLSADVTKLTDYRRMITPGAAWLSFLDLDGQPIDLRARVSATWSRGAWSSGASLNYTDDYRSAAGARIDRWTTLDAQITWRGERGFAEGLAATLSVRNLFDKDPPFFDNLQGVAYDPANADPLGRFAALQLTKRW